MCQPFGDYKSTFAHFAFMSLLKGFILCSHFSNAVFTSQKGSNIHFVVLMAVLILLINSQGLILTRVTNRHLSLQWMTV